MSNFRPARRELRKWLTGTGRTQERLALAVGVSQQTISALRGGRVPSEDLAQVIEEATGIAWRGWFTENELQTRDLAREKRLVRAREMRAARL